MSPSHDLDVSRAECVPHDAIRFVVNQMVGFALWPTTANNFSIANTAFRGGGYDIMAEYIAACNVFNIKPGIFYTTKENNYNGIGRGAAIGPKNYTIAEQDRFIVQQLTELMLGKYAPIYELWLDGGLGAEYSQVKSNESDSLLHVLPRLANYFQVQSD